ncbi:arsenate reductase [Polymorphobacter multimanifer]|uniref:Spx/MgsR family transcriptional regulator n=1 Tax=Polymorphobacter multimanifer TaxID=1070431 RepID=A0A841L7W9_9SPHN|nr:arsenate reductase [Polymorphobacter multimanifer]MBB6227053.1 Spx/MgsR family transcriptional regulator [Polymorphobacter multimanifer]
MLTLHGIPNCDTVKKARTWLAAAGIEARFHDFRKDGVPEALDDWVTALGWEVLLNRAGTSFRALPEAERTGLDAGRALALMRTAPAMIKRPVLCGTSGGGRPVLQVSFKPENWAAALAD